jgi:hypothetical protein
VPSRPNELETQRLDSKLEREIHKIEELAAACVPAN